MSMTKNTDESRIKNHFIFSGKNILVKKEGSSISGLPDESTFRSIAEENPDTDWFAEPELKYAATSLPAETPVPEGFSLIPLRELFATDEKLAPAAARAKGILEWRRTVRFCSTCGSPLEDHETFTARRCPSCGREIFPSISPCIIVLVEKEGKLLLARHRQRNCNMYTCLAGYMEPGENIEECVKREVLEETGIHVKNVRYVKSQSWPFPDQLMLGFHAEYESGELRLQEEEISEARWFSRNDLPSIPAPGSLAWDLISGRI